MNHIKKKWNKILSAILSLAIMLSCVPVQPIFADGGLALNNGSNIEIILSKETPEVQTDIVITSFPTERSEDDITTIEWSSSESGVVSVGEIDSDMKLRSITTTAKKAGTAVIMCTVNYRDTDDDETNDSYTSSVTVTVKQKLTLEITVTNSTVTYPDEVIFNVTSTPSLETTGQTVKFVKADGSEITDRDGSAIVVGTPCVLPVGTGIYDVYAKVEANGKGVEARSENSATLTVAKGTTALSVTATKGTSAIDPGVVTFNITSNPALEADQIPTLTVKKVGADGNETEVSGDKNKDPIEAGNPCVLKVGTYKVEASVAESGNYAAARSESITYTVNPVTPELTVTATSSNNMAYPDAVTFGVTSSVDLGITGQTPTLTVKKVGADGNETVITKDKNNKTIALNDSCALKVGTYKAYVEVEATEDGTYTDSSNFITYTVSQGTPQLTVSAEPSPSVVYPGKVKFSVTSAPSLSELGREVEEVELVDGTGNAIKDREDQNIIAGQEHVLKVGTYTVYAKVEASADEQYEGTMSNPITYVVNQGIASWDITEDDTNVYVGEKIEIALPKPKDALNNEIEGTYNLTLENLTLGNLTGTTSVAAGGSVTLTAGAVGNANLKVTFSPADPQNYKSGRIDDEIDYTVESIPIKVKWTSDFSRTYDGTTSYTMTNIGPGQDGKPVVYLAESFNGAPTVLPGLTNTEYVFALKDTEGNAASNVGTWTGTIAQESLVLSDADEAVYTIIEVEPISVQITPIKLTAENIDFSDVIPTGKAYDASSEVKWSSNNPEFVYTRNIPANLEDELLALELKYTADYYDDNDNKVCGNPDANTVATKIKFDNVKIMQGSAEATNYVLASPNVIPIIATSCPIKANSELNQFTGLGLNDVVTDKFNDKELKIHWINQNGEKAIVKKAGYMFSGNGSTATEGWEPTYELTQEGNPKKVYAKNISVTTEPDTIGLISAGSYVAWDKTVPDGQIYAVVGTGDSAERIPIKDLSNEFKTIIAEGKGVQIVFEGDDVASKIATIEYYGTNEAWDSNDEDRWTDVEAEATTYNVNRGDVKAVHVEQQLGEIIGTRDELKQFYYVRVTDYAGNVNYISSGGVLVDITSPTVTPELAPSTKTFDGKNVYTGDVNFTVSLKDNDDSHDISSGIVKLEAVLKDRNGQTIASYDLDPSTTDKTDDIWSETSSDQISAINNLYKNENPTNAEIEATRNIQIEGTLANLPEANGYTLSFVSVDKVGHRSLPEEISFIVDNEAPIVTITDNRNYIGTKAAHFTGGSMTVTVKDYTLTTSVADLVTGIEDAEASWTKTVNSADGLITQEITLEFGADKTYREGQYSFDVKAEDSMNRESEDACAPFTLDYTAPRYRVEYSRYHADSLTTDKTTTGDDIFYYKDDITAIFAIDEATSYDDSKIKVVVKNKAGVTVMKWEDVNEDGNVNGNEEIYVKDSYYSINYLADDKKFEFKVDAVTAAQDDGYTYEISGTDFTGNLLVHDRADDLKEVNAVRVLDVTAPELTSVEYDAVYETVYETEVKDALEEGLFKTITTSGENNANVVRDYINAPTTMTFKIEEHNPTTNKYFLTSNGDTATENTWQQYQENGEDVADTYTSSIDVPMLGRYGDEQAVKYTIIDKAGNVAKVAEAQKEVILRHYDECTTFDNSTGIFTDRFTVDIVKPEIEYEYEGYNPDRNGTEAEDGIDYFRLPELNVKVTVTEHNFNGMDTSVELYDEAEENATPGGNTAPGENTREIVAEGEQSSANATLWESNGDKHTKVITLKGDDLYKITILGNDCANNGLLLGEDTKRNVEVSATQEADTNITKLSVALDKNLPIISDSAKPTITVSGPESTTSSGTNVGQRLFGGDVTFKVTVYDPVSPKFASGINTVKFNLEAEDGTNSEATVAKRGNNASGNGITVTLSSGDPDKLGRDTENKLEYNVTVSSSIYNSNNIKLKVTAEDVATNTNEVEAEPFSIDTTPPEVTISYDNNNVSNLKYFNETRNASIQVRERNFSDDCMTFTVNGSNVGLTFTQASSGTGNGDDSIWTATYAFENDNDYLVAGDCQDRINNVGTVKFTGEAAEDFIVDKTLPTMEIEFDNNNAFNENYFDAQRTATVIITEHNFNPDEVEIIGNGTDAGATVSYPTLSGWSSNGDVHRATLTYSQDALYTLDVEYTDLATNEAEDIEEEEFTIDNTDPEIIISGVEDQMPYSGEVRPEISFSDNNYDSHTITMTRTERENIGVDVTEAVIGAVGVSIDGTGKGTGSRILEDVEHLEENDGIYTLTVNVVDKAGRSTEEMITYSVNRFGSVYVYSQDLVDMLNGYYQEIEGDLYITAYNANQLVNDSTKLEITCDGSRVENQNTVADVASARQNTAGGWFEYRFRLDHDDFKKDGCYEITLSDKDEAGNTRTNSDAPVSFYIDATAPMIDSIIGLEESIVNANEHQIGYAISDAIALDSVAVYVNDEQVDKITDFDNTTAFEGAFTLGAGMRQNVRIVAHDKAGNMVDTAAESFAPAYAFNPEITVSTNFLVRWYANTAAFWGSIGAAAVVSGGAITAGVVKVRKKNKIVEED